MVNEEYVEAYRSWDFEPLKRELLLHQCGLQQWAKAKDQYTYKHIRNLFDSAKKAFEEKQDRLYHGRRASD